MNKENVNIGEKFKVAFQNYEIAPAPKVWTNIASSIRPGVSVFGKKFSYLKIAISSFTALSLVAVILLSINYSQNSNQKTAFENSISSKQEIQTSPKNTIESEMASQDLAQSNMASIAKTSKSNDDQLVADENKTINSSTLVNNPKNDEISIFEEKKTNVTNIVKEEIKITTPKNTSVKNTKIENLNTSNNTEISDNKGSGDTTVKISYSSDPTICFGEDVVLEVSTGDLTYNWDNGSTNAKIRVKPLQNSEYSVIVTDKFGKNYYHTFKINIDRECTAVFAPSAFTPNGDGNNDLFIAQGVGIQEFYMQVANRAGKIMYESTDMTKGWDAYNVKEITTSDVYVYVIKYVDAKGNHHLQKGQVTLIR